MGAWSETQGRHKGELSLYATCRRGNSYPRFSSRVTSVFHLPDEIAEVNNEVIHPLGHVALVRELVGVAQQQTAHFLLRLRRAVEGGGEG